MVLTALLLLVTAARIAAPASGTDFHLVLQQCGSTVASLRPDGKIAATVRPASQGASNHCVRSGEVLSCAGDSSSGEYHIVLDEDSTLQAQHPTNGGWITLNTARGTAVTVQLGNLPTHGNSPGTDGLLDGILVIVCRGKVITSAEAAAFPKRK
jgi:hypothetical protein